MPYASELALRLVPYVAGEQPKGFTFIKLNTNENPYPPSPRIEQALYPDIDALRLYPDPESTDLRQAIAKVNGLFKEQVFCGNGSDEVLALAFAAFFAGKTLVSPDITYSFYPVYANLFGADYRTVPLKEDFTVDVDGLCQGCPIVLANPNAPTGLMLPISEIRRLAEHARAHGQVLLVDEAYAAFAPENALPLLREFDNLLIVRTFSKSHALAGLRVGYALGDPNLIDLLRRVRDSFNSYPVDRKAQEIARLAIEHEAYAAHICQRIMTSRNECLRRLTQAGIEVLPSATNFLFVRAHETDAAPVQQALRREGILVRHFAKGRLAPWLRVTIGTEEDMPKVTNALIRCIHKAMGMIETPRLLLRPMTEKDAEAAFAWLSDPEVNRYMPYPLYTSVEDARKWLLSLTPECGEFGFVRKEDGLLIGAGSIKQQEDGSWEVGYNLRRDCWRCGYATEAAWFLMDWAHREKGATRFTAAHVTANTASGRVLQKCGFQFVRYGQYGRFDGSEIFDASFYEKEIK